MSPQELQKVVRRQPLGEGRLVVDARFIRHDHDRIFDDHGELTVGTVCEAEEQTSNVDTAAPSAIAVIITVAAVVAAAVVAALVVLAAVLARIVAWVVMTADACPLTRRSCRFQSRTALFPFRKPIV